MQRMFYRLPKLRQVRVRARSIGTTTSLGYKPYSTLNNVLWIHGVPALVYGTFLVPFGCAVEICKYEIEMEGKLEQENTLDKCKRGAWGASVAFVEACVWEVALWRLFKSTVKDHVSDKQEMEWLTRQVEKMSRENEEQHQAFVEKYNIGPETAEPIEKLNQQEITELLEKMTREREEQDRAFMKKYNIRLETVEPIEKLNQQEITELLEKMTREREEQDRAFMEKHLEQ